MQYLPFIQPALAEVVSATLSRFDSGTLSNGNRTFMWDAPLGSAFACAYVYGTAARTGKAYFEFVNDGPSRGVHIGFIEQAEWNTTTALGDYPDNPYGELFWGICNGNTLGMVRGLLTSGTPSTNLAYDFVAGDVIGVAVDFDTGKVWFSKNGVWISGDPAAGTSPTFSGLSAAIDPYVSLYNEFATMQVTGNFAATDWVHSAPSGFNALAGAA